MKKHNRSIWFYLSSFMVTYTFAKAVVTFLQVHLGVEGAASVLLEFGLPTLTISYLFVTHEKQAPAKGAFWGLFVGSLATSLPISMMVKSLILTGGIHPETPAALLSVPGDNMGLFFIIDLVIRGLAFGLGYGYFARLLVDAQKRSSHSK